MRVSIFCQWVLLAKTSKRFNYVYLSHPGQQCRTSCTNTSHSVQKSFEQSVHRYRPKGLIPSVPISIATPVVPSAEFGPKFPFVAGVTPLATEFLLAGPDGVVCWNILEHAWHVGLELAVSSAVILRRDSPKEKEISIRWPQQPNPTVSNRIKSSGMRERAHSHRSIGLDGEQMMITPRQMWGTDDHQPAHITIRWYVAYFGRTTGTQKPLRLHLRMTHA